MVLLLSVTYLLIIKKIVTGMISKQAVWTLFLLTSLILLFSYNAFSYDLFNYIFDAKILTHYHQNPYLHKALDFPSDPMLSFMHWTHRTYPYGPVWLVISLPFSFLGLNYFVVTFFLFKFLIISAFIGMVYIVSKIMHQVSPEREVLSIGLIAFHPLFIIEYLVSAHNDSVMMFFAFLAVFLILRKKLSTGSISLLASVGIKYATAFHLPSVLFLAFAKRYRVHAVWSLFFLLSGIFLLVAALFASRQTNFQPWYLTWALPFFLLLPLGGYYKAAQVVGAVSSAMVLLYLPFLFTGDWEHSIPSNFIILVWSLVCLFYLVVFIRLLLQERRKTETEV
jgi:hypothetical protein